MVFESPALVPAIDRSWIYPEKDEVLEAILATPEGDPIKPPALAWEPSVSLIRAPTYEAYLPVAHALLEHNRQKLPELADRTRRLDWDVVLQELSLLHAVIRSPANKVQRYLTTLHHFERVVRRVMAAKTNDLSRFLHTSYFDHCPDDLEKFKVTECLWFASPFWKQVVQDGLNGTWPERE